MTRRLRLTAASGLATLGAGLAAGLLARLAMRAVALLTGQPPEFSIPGTVGILLAFTVMAAPLAGAYVAWGRHRRRIRSAWPLAGLLVFAAVVTLTPLRSELGGRPALIPLFAPAALMLGWGGALLVEAVLPRLPERGGGARIALYGTASLPGAAGTILLPLLLVMGVLQTLGVIEVPAN